LTVYLEPHVAAFTRAGDPALLSPAAAHTLEAAQSTRVSRMVVVELQYLFELSRIAYPGDEIAGFPTYQFCVVVDTDGVGEAVLQAGAFLLTREKIKRPHYHASVW